MKKEDRDEVDVYNVHMSNELGSGNPKFAALSVLVVTLMTFIISVIIVVIILCARDYISYIFTDGESVADVVPDLCPLLTITIILNGIQLVLPGVAVGCGWQAFVAYVNVSCYYIIGVPGSVLHGFKFGFGLGAKHHSTWLMPRCNTHPGAAVTAHRHCPGVVCTRALPKYSRCCCCLYMGIAHQHLQHLGIAQHLSILLLTQYMGIAHMLSTLGQCPTAVCCAQHLGNLGAAIAVGISQVLWQHLGNAQVQ